MKSKARVLAYSFQFQEMFLSKDIFLVPYYIAKCLGGTLDYIYCQNLGNTDIPSSHRDASLIKSSSNNDFRSMLKYIVEDAKNIDVVFMWGSSLKHMIVIRMYKMLNPHGKVVIFGDMEFPQAQVLNQTDFMCPSGIKGVVKRYFTNFFMNNTTFIVANTEAYKEMKKLCERRHWKGLLHFYPCLDDEKIHEYGIKRKPWEEKENVMVCVGRIGCYQKNTEMLLDALEKVDLKDWKIYMIGPITSSFDLNESGNFQNTIDDFFKRNPQYKEKLIFTGMVYDQKEVFEYYNKAKVLLSTSRHEGFANVYSQGAAFGCFVMSTDVGGADVASNQWCYGLKIEQENVTMLTKSLQDLVDGNILFDHSKSYSLSDISYGSRVNRVLLQKLGLCSEKMIR